MTSYLKVQDEYIALSISNHAFERTMTRSFLPAVDLIEGRIKDLIAYNEEIADLLMFETLDNESVLLKDKETDLAYVIKRTDLSSFTVVTVLPYQAKSYRSVIVITAADYISFENRRKGNAVYAVN